jgi:outer membrane protein OmpA-like peptidoglycan-associated protein
MIDLNEAGDGMEQTAPVWAVFGDLMSGPAGRLRADPGGRAGGADGPGGQPESEMAKRRQEEQRRMALEKALAIPLASGRVTLANGRIGISGSVLFALNSDQLRPTAPAAEKPGAPLQRVPGRARRDADGQRLHRRPPVTEGNRRFEDNLELSAQRALTVTRALIDEGMPLAARVRRRLWRRAAGGRPTPTRQAARRTGAWRWRPWPVPQRNPPLALNQYIGTLKRSGDGPLPGLGLSGPAVEGLASEGAAHRELPSVRRFREAWSRIAAEDQVTQAVERGPANAGPLNSHMLVLRTLALLRDLSPDYLRRFLSQMETLQWLEQASQTIAPVKPKPARRSRVKK